MQNPPPNPGYGEQYGAAADAGAKSKAAIGLDGNVAAALGYPIGVLAIINLVMEKQNRFVRFHAMQAILILVVWIVLAFVMMFLSVILAIIGGLLAQVIGSVSGIIVGLLYMLLWVLVPLLLLAGLIFAAVKAYQGQMYKLPLIGNMAEKFIGQ